MVWRSSGKKKTELIGSPQQNNSDYLNKQTRASHGKRGLFYAMIFTR